MDFSAEGILERMRSGLKNEDTKMEGSFSMDNLQAVSEELARFNAMLIVPLMNMLANAEDDMGTSGNERHYVRWAKEAMDSNGKRIAGNAKVNAVRDGTGLVSVVILTTEAREPTQEQIDTVQRYIDERRPIGARPVVSGATGIDVIIAGRMKKLPGYTDETVEAAILRRLQEHFTAIAFQSGAAILNYYTVSAIISGTEGIAELVCLRINGSQESIAAEYDRYFVLKEVRINGVE